MRKGLCLTHRYLSENRLSEDETQIMNNDLDMEQNDACVEDCDIWTDCCLSVCLYADHVHGTCYNVRLLVYAIFSCY